MSLGQFLAGAGNVSRGMRTAEEAERRARENQLKIEEQNRLADMKARLAQEQLASFQQQATPGLAVPSFPVGPDNGILPQRIVEPPPAPVAPAPAAGLRPGQMPLPPGVVPSEAGAGRGSVNPPMARPDTTVPLTPDEIRQGYNRLALLRAPTAAYDIVQAPAAAGLNLAGRGVNYLFGTNLPTDFPLTPAYDRFVREPEKELKAGVRTVPQPPAAPEKPAKGDKPAAPTAARSPAQYDRPTAYDAIIQQSAQQYGVDATVLKRLIGTESSFSPTAVSPRGEKFGLGIAQIADVHGLSREQRLDPNTAIPFAAQLLGQYLREANGNYEEALLRYKGASSPKGRADMAGPVATILSGAAPADAAAPAAGLTPATATATDQVSVGGTSENWLADPQSIPYEMQRLQTVAQQQAALLTQQRNETARLAQIYMQSGTGPGIETAMRMRESLGQIDAGLMQLQQQFEQSATYMQGMQGIQEFSVANDPRRLAAVWSQYAGVPIGIQPRSDGKFDIIVNGKRTREGLDRSDVINRARLGFDQTYRQQQAAAGAKFNEERFKSILKREEDAANQQAEMVKQIYIERAKGDYALAVEQLRQSRYDVKPTGYEGSMVITPPGVGAVPFFFNASGRTVEIDGVKVTSFSAYPISGLPSFGGQQAR